MNTYIRQIDGKWYAFGADEENNQVYGIGSDCPKGGRSWVGSWTDTGIKYVACSSDTRRAAYQKARRNGKYSGEA